MVELMPEINGFVRNALACLNSYFMKETGDKKDGLSKVYPYAFEEHQDIDMIYEVEAIPSQLGILYESLISDGIKKDLGQFYTRADSVVETMVDSANLLDGKILEKKELILILLILFRTKREIISLIHPCFSLKMD